MNYDWVADQILNHELSDAVTAIVARGKDDTIDALRDGQMANLPCGHEVSFADDTDGAKCLLCEAEKLAHLWESRCAGVVTQARALQKALKAIAKHGSGLSKVVAELTLKEVRDAKRG